ANCYRDLTGPMAARLSQERRNPRGHPGDFDPEQPGRLTECRRAYGVRSAVTNRACRIITLLPAARRQEASKFGQALSEQSRPTCLMSRRAPLASATGTLAST